MVKNVLNLNSIDAREFFLKPDSYSNIELPEYFILSKVLSDIKKIFKDNELKKTDLEKAKQYETVNHVLYGNKDGKYAWRKYQVINPLIYSSLINIITEKNNWNSLKLRFEEFQRDKSIECESIPIVQKSNRKQIAAQISHWVENVERKSISLALRYNFLYQTDITDCYGSIYTHSIPWAIHTKLLSKDKRKYDDLFGNKIDQHIQAMSFGQTNGIPQGSTLMDFIAEIVLGYADLNLAEKLRAEMNGRKFHVLRYRDDYRIFVNNTVDGDIILKCLGEILSSLGFSLNTNKTRFNDNVVHGSIKEDKLESLQFGHVPKKLTKEELLRQLLIIQRIGKTHPNSGTLKNRLSKILNAVRQKDFSSQEENIVALLTNIAYNSPNTFSIIAGLISDCISKLKKKEQEELISLVKNKMCQLSNFGLLEIWVQRIFIKLKFKLELEEKLCKAVYNKNQKIFETNWIDNKALKTAIDDCSNVDQKKLAKIKSKIEKREVQIFTSYYD